MVVVRIGSRVIRGMAAQEHWDEVMATQNTNKSGYIGLAAAAATALAALKFHFLEGVHVEGWGHLFSAPMIVDPVSLNPAQIAATLGALVAPQVLSSVPGVSHVMAFFGMPAQISSVADDVKAIRTKTGA